MPLVISAITARKVHCCLLVLVLFILIFLSLPLLLIYLANTRYEEDYQRTQMRHLQQPSILNSSFLLNNTSDQQAEVSQQQLQSQLQTNQIYPPAAFNCTQFAIKYNLSQADENGKH